MGYKKLKKHYKKLNGIFKKYREIKLVYLFGSRARGEESILSDFDFAIFLNTKDKTRMYKIKIDLMNLIWKELKTDNVDIVILNITDNPVLKYMIITEGHLIYEKEPYKIIIEPKILNEYFDFQLTLSKHHLTKSKT